MSPPTVNALSCASPVNLEAIVRLPLPDRDAGLRPEAVAVRNALVRRGLETPLVEGHLSAEEKRQRIQLHFAEIMRLLGLDLSDDSLADTPRRVAKMFVHEVFSGLDYRNFPKLTVVENKMQVDEMVRVDNINVSSTCEHHFVTIDGIATVAYIPRNKVIGLSKINRVVAFFARRPQIQERLTEQVLLALQTLLETEDVAVSITAVHFCVKARGVMDANSQTTTTALGGGFKTRPETRKEFLAGLRPQRI
ncbi:MAG: GTP cyclohydrolase I FolE [Gammaproteobacteria bacterium]|nr:GTP cyclohydrolase I FolE [Gammaproteobacteria bacterium]